MKYRQLFDFWSLLAKALAFFLKSENCSTFLERGKGYTIRFSNSKSVLQKGIWYYVFFPTGWMTFRAWNWKSNHVLKSQESCSLQWSLLKLRGINVTSIMELQGKQCGWICANLLYCRGESYGTYPTRVCLRVHYYLKSLELRVCF